VLLKVNGAKMLAEGLLLLQLMYSNPYSWTITSVFLRKALLRLFSTCLYICGKKATSSSNCSYRTTKSNLSCNQ